MNRSFLDLLACPADKHHPLEMYGDGGADPVTEAVLHCNMCGRFYPITGGIPVLLPDDLRDREADLGLLKKLPGLPERVTRRGLPWNLSN